MRILYCHCANTQLVPRKLKDEVLGRLSASGVEFEAVADLCELAAQRDPLLKELADSGRAGIIACYPRAVRWLFHAAGADLPADGIEIANMRTQGAAEIIQTLLGDAACAQTRPAPVELRPKKPGEWIPWFPVIDYSRCKNCQECLSFCLFGVYGLSGDGKVQVQQPGKCKTNCPACARVCPQAAIIFPKYKGTPINGDEVRPEDIESEKMRVDLAALMGTDAYAALRKRRGGGGLFKKKPQ
jgi:NAD-dependent dihydropyrimidine dehydrogenase PreA subunit